MAKSKHKIPQPDRKLRRPGRIRRWSTMFVVMVCLIVGFPTAIVIAVGMMPTIVSFIVDITPGKYACRCVAGLNVAGVVPFVDKLWSGYNDIGAAINIIGDTLAWLAFYGSAGFGWVLFWAVPGVVSTARMLNARRIIHGLKASQENLAIEWDLEIKTNDPDGKDGKADKDEVDSDVTDENFAEP